MTCENVTLILDTVIEQIIKHLLDNKPGIFTDIEIGIAFKNNKNTKTAGLLYIRSEVCKTQDFKNILLKLSAAACLGEVIESMTGGSIHISQGDL